MTQPATPRHDLRSKALREIIDHCIDLHARLRLAAEAMSCDPDDISFDAFDKDVHITLHELGHADFMRYMEQR